jgi:hypothetical protein
MLTKPPYVAPYGVIFTDPITKAVLFNQVFDGGGYRRVDKIPAGLKIVIGNNDKGWSDVRINRLIKHD